MRRPIPKETLNMSKISLKICYAFEWRTETVQLWHLFWYFQGKLYQITYFWGKFFFFRKIKKKKQQLSKAVVKYSDLRRLKCPASEGNVVLFLWHQETPFRSHLKSKGTQPSHTEVLECVGGSSWDQEWTVASHWLLCEDNGQYNLGEW